MTEEQFVIYNSKLEEAHNTSNREWLETTFSKASQIIKAGGKVNIMQRFSGDSKELVAIIDDPETLEFYKRKYLT